MVDLLLRNGANPDIQDTYKVTPLMMAAFEGDTETISVLKEYNARANLQDRDGETALMVATEKGHDKAIQALSKVIGIDI
ncbi:MAG: ankyrin repeat domain-containing protein [Rickettsiales bacterium]|nr:ankyrin repeat domain-containing protein [Rickettsiales bacterium]